MTEGSSGKREYPEYPLPAVAGLILDSNHNILLVQRKHPPAKMKWSLPGGVIELGETPEETLLREIEEECSIQANIGPLFNVFPKIIRDHQKKIQYHYIILNYLCQYISGAIYARSDAHAVQWFPTQQVEELSLSEGMMCVIQKGIRIEKNRNGIY